ncbi:MAG: DUF1569 domain-containing protein [Bacteroidota bacterium]
METTHLQYLQEKVPLLLEKLQADTKPAWGIMTAQHMIEHLGGIVRYSASYRAAPILTPPDELPTARALVLSGDFPKNFRVGPVPKDPPSYRFASLEEATAKLLESLKKATDFLSSNPEKTSNHPVAGKLTGEEWLQFHAGHFKHHFKQFELE